MLLYDLLNDNVDLFTSIASITAILAFIGATYLYYHNHSLNFLNGLQNLMRDFNLAVVMMEKNSTINPPIFFESHGLGIAAKSLGKEVGSIDITNMSKDPRFLRDALFPVIVRCARYLKDKPYRDKEGLAKLKEKGDPEIANVHNQVALLEQEYVTTFQDLAQRAQNLLLLQRMLLHFRVGACAVLLLVSLVSFTSFVNSICCGS